MVKDTTLQYDILHELHICCESHEDRLENFQEKFSDCRKRIQILTSVRYVLSRTDHPT